MDTAQNRTSIPNEAPQQARSRATYASFGDNGTTATANAYGHLLQITRYFGNKPSGFFCADLPTAPEPYFVADRMDYLQDSCQKATRGMRLLLDGEDKEKWRAEANIDALPKMGFLQDRWPSFTTETPAFHLDIQYLISQSAVYQIYTYKLKEGSLILPKIPKLAIYANLLLRNLNFTEYDKENVRDGNDEHYKHLILNDGHTIATVHEFNQVESTNKDAVGLFISIFINGRLQTFKAAEQPEIYRDLVDLEDYEDPEDCKYYEITPDLKTTADLLEQKCLKVTVAYKLDIVSSGALMDMHPVYSRESLGSAEKIINNPFTIIPFSKDQNLNFILRRNLEHILSVCCIPTNDSAYCTTIALTCGDVSGHRIATAASFYAFQLLLTALEYFEKKGLNCSCLVGNGLCEDYACKLSYRIRIACRGHLKWLSSAHMMTEEDLLSTSHWASGETIPGCESSFEVPITNTLFSLIKAASFCHLVADQNTRSSIAEAYKDMATMLTSQLHQNNKINEYIFPRFKEQTPHTFYTSDHATIWWAIKSAEELGLASSCVIPQDIGQQEMKYASSKMQKSMLVKMTAHNPDAKRSMLTTSRSLLEAKFLLGANDTILFHAMSVGLFDKKNSVEDESDIWKNKIDAWKNTVDWQEDLDTAISDPRQIALLYILSANNICVDSRPAGEVYDLTKSALLTTSSSNGLFPGQLDENREPVLFDNELLRDPYWHVTFEVPYILWNYRKRKPIEDSHLTAGYIADQRLSELAHGMETMIGKIDAMATSPTAIVLRKSVNEIPNEWLYDEPNFFKFHQDVSSDSIVQLCEENEEKSYGTVVDDAMSSVQAQNRHDTFKDDLAGYIIDVPRTKGLYAKTRAFDLKEVNKSEDFGPCIKEKRAPATSKKRFFHFHPLNRNVALACFFASSEKDAIASFFDRHASYDRYFSETTTLALNKWVTELHLPFYQIRNQEPSSGKYHTIAKMVGIPFLPSSEREESTIWINRATMSFRFDGDVFDRYWTCHFIEYSPRIISEGQMNRYEGEQNPHSITTRQIMGEIKEHSWRQRKVLELVLFDLMLEEILRSTKEILEEARSRIEKSFRPETITSFNPKASRSVILDPLDLIDKVDNSMFLSTNSLWNELEPIFQLMQDALHEILAIVTHWTDREKSRGRDQPQWTLNDESTYGRSISALQTSNRRRIHEIERCDAEIASFNALFARKLEVMRSELDRRGADDIRLFTYVTVVFLPVGFATSVFSMSGAPSRDILHGMIILAIVALLITFIALVNARILDRVLGPIFGACRVVTEAIVNPLIRELHKFIQPVGKFVYLLLCRPVYAIAIRYYDSYSTRPLALGDSQKDNHELGTGDQDPEQLSQDMQKLEHETGKHYQDTESHDQGPGMHKQKREQYKQMIELGPISAARKRAMTIQTEKKAKIEQEVKDIERGVKYEKEKIYKKEEEEKFRKTEQTELNEKFLKEVEQILTKELKDAVKARLETLDKDMDGLSSENKIDFEDWLRRWLEPSIKERLVKEAQGRIRRQTNLMIKTRVKKRIDKEVRERLVRKRKDEEEEWEKEEEERRKRVRHVKEARSGIIRRMIRKKSQITQSRSAGEEIGNQV